MTEDFRAKIFSVPRAWFLPLLFVIPMGCAPAASGPAEQAAAQPEKKIDVFQVLVINEDGSTAGIEKSYTFAGVVIDRARRVKRNETDSEVKVTDKMPSGKNPGKAYDIIFVSRPSEIKNGKLLTLTSAPVASCRPFVAKFLTETLSPKRFAKAYKGAKLATVDKDGTAKSLAENLKKNGWLKSC